MSRFKQEFLGFFRALDRNNNKDWFEANRSMFEREVKRPFTEFVTEMIALISSEDREIVIAPADAIFRLNRDTRFSKDKTPYKTHMAANISRYGRKNKEYPGFYFHLGADKVMLGGGAHTLENENVYKVRKAIAGNQRVLESLLADKEFMRKFGSLKGERNKTLAPEFKDHAINQPLVANKQFYFMAELDAEILLRRDLPEFFMRYYRAGEPINQFLRKALE